MQNSNHWSSWPSTPQAYSAVPGPTPKAKPASAKPTPKAKPQNP
jgi:hypothetical protein